MSRRRNNYLSSEGKSQRDQYSVIYKVFPQDTGTIEQNLKTDDYERQDIDQFFTKSSNNENDISRPIKKVHFTKSQEESDRYRETVPNYPVHHTSFENLEQNIALPSENPDYKANKIMRTSAKKNNITYYV